MARGWESKEVESQIESAAESRRIAALRSAPAPSATEQQRKNELDSLQMSRTRVVHEMEAARHPRHREMLEMALRDLDQRIARLS